LEHDSGEQIKVHIKVENLQLQLIEEQNAKLNVMNKKIHLTEQVEERTKAENIVHQQFIK